jgi:hypothetical protein
MAAGLASPGPAPLGGGALTGGGGAETLGGGGADHPESTSEGRIDGRRGGGGFERPIAN